MAVTQESGAPHDPPPRIKILGAVHVVQNIDFLCPGAVGDWLARYHVWYFLVLWSVFRASHLWYC